MSPPPSTPRRIVRLAATKASLRALLFTLAVAISGCGGRTGPAQSPRENAVVVLKSNVRDAQLYVDGRFIGPLDAIGGGVALAPGTHRFELRHEEYFSTYLELTLAKSERKKLDVSLAPVLP